MNEMGEIVGAEQRDLIEAMDLNTKAAKHYLQDAN